MSHHNPMGQDQKLQRDVVAAFSMRSHKLFRRENEQIYAIVGFNPALRIISDVWFDSFDSQDDFRGVLDHIRACFEEGGYCYWLADLRFLTSDFSASEDWLVRDFMPAVFTAGLEREAVVLPDAALKVEGADAYATGARALRDLADGRVRGFTNVALAKRWLLEGKLPGE